jgi:hypothetical protein
MKYKGEMVAIGELMKLNTAIPVFIETGEMPDVLDKGGYTISYGAKVNKLMIITKIEEFTPGMATVSYQKYINFDGRIKNFNALTGTQILKLTGKQGTAMLEFIKKWELENFHTKLSNQKFYSGSDPEIFAEKNKIIIPAFHYLGTKENPKHFTKKINDFEKNNKVYADGFATEFETDAQSCLAYHIDSIAAGMKASYDAVKAYDPKANLTIRNNMMIPADIMDAAKDEDVAFGCNPSLNVYGLKGRLVGPRDLPFRFAGGHIHFGCGPQSKDKVEAGVKALDKVLAVACVSLFAKQDSSMRRSFYGLPGEYRLPKHGLEYRTLSNAWLCHPLITNFVFDLARKVLNMGMQGLGNVWEATEEETIEVIMTHNVEKARQILERNKTIFMKLLQAAYGGGGMNDGSLEAVYQTFLNGVEYMIKDPNDLESNWHLKGGWIRHCANPNKNFASAADNLINKVKV